MPESAETAEASATVPDSPLVEAAIPHRVRAPGIVARNPEPRRARTHRVAIRICTTPG